MSRSLLVVIITLTLAGSSWAQGWTVSGGGDVTLSGSAALFPRGQDNRPSIGNQQDTDSGIRFPASGQMSFILDGSRVVLFDASGFVVGVNYFNFGTVAGTLGYGIRNNAGTIEYKNSGGSWGAITTTGTVNTWSSQQTFTVAPIFSSGTANRVMALDASKALTTTFASADLLGSLSDETGTGVAVFGTSPTIAAPVFSGTATGTYTLGGTATLTTPALGTPASGVLTNATGLPVSTGIAGFGTGVATALAVNVGSAGAPVLNGGALGTPSSGTLTSATGLPLTTGITGTLAIGNGGTGLTSAADDTVPLSSGSAWVATAVTNCVDTGGNHLNYTASTNAFSCGTTTGSPTFTNDLTFTSDAVIHRNTSDASDTGTIELNGGGAAGVTRGGALFVYGNEHATTAKQGGVFVQLSNTAESAFKIYASDGTTQVMAAIPNGSVYMSNMAGGSAGDEDVCKNASTGLITDANASTCIVSSLRYKSNWQPLHVGLASVLQLTPGSFYYTNDEARTPRIGLNAENMASVEPRLAFYEQDGPDKGKPRGVAYEETVALLVKAIQELTACVKVSNPRACLAGIETGREPQQHTWARKLLPW